MTSPTKPGRRRSTTHLRRETVILLIAAPLVVVAVAVMFLSATSITPPPGAPAAAQVVPEADGSRISVAAPTAGVAPEGLASARAGPGSDVVPEAPSPPAVVPSPAVAAGPSSGPTALPPGLSLPAIPNLGSLMYVPALSSPPAVVARLAEPAPIPRDYARREPDAGVGELAGEPADFVSAIWMRRLFDVFLNLMGPPRSTLPQHQRDALFAEFMVWRGARASEDRGLQGP